MEYELIEGVNPGAVEGSDESKLGDGARHRFSCDARRGELHEEDEESV